MCVALLAVSLPAQADRLRLNGGLAIGD